MSIAAEGFIEYTRPDGAVWRIEEGNEVIQDFELQGPEVDVLAELNFWHDVLRSQALAWKVVCRFYAVNPLFGEQDVAELERWTPLRIAEALGLPDVESVGFQIKEAQCRWRLARGSARRSEARAQVAAAPAPLDDAAVEELLKAHGFREITEPDERHYIARRIEELSAHMESDQTRSLARSLIQQEVNIFFGLDVAIAKARRKVREASDVESKQADQRLQELTKSRSSSQEAVENTRKALGLNEAQTGSLRLKAQVQGTLTAIIEGMQRYYARQDTALIDGMFTLAEVELLLKEYTIRPTQYRPDIVASVHEAMKDENLFSPEWEPPKFGRKAIQRLRAGLRKGLAEARNEEGETLDELDEESREEVIDQAERQGQRGIGLASAEAAVPPTATPLPASAPRRPAAAGSAHDGVWTL